MHLTTCEIDRLTAINERMKVLHVQIGGLKRIMTWLTQDDCTVAVIMEIHNNTICADNNAAVEASKRLAASIKVDEKLCRKKLQHLFGESAGLRFCSMILTEKEMELQDLATESEALLRRATLPTTQQVMYAI